ncbi:peptidoglycan-binding protein [Kibdelosporangium aridum]|uniref:Peptidoglycan-binding protein n=1 Tax=Kibdelosporangium aridum TaxID=2030 RepID=A0A428ZCM1_KIBAR|nr:peptidoglycan-binding domain-containing protein [Kibdelosporangium aridum]RSM85813.1 peptidoglycan-binding protein [Kibdelosporangium aridum]
MIVVSLALLSFVVPADDSSTSTSTAEPGPAAEPVDLLRKCPTLKRGQRDPINGDKCVRELQKKLQILGYDQDLTGIFADRTEANVKAFQLSRSIAPPVGIFGPKTRDALLGPPHQPDIPEPTFSTDACTSTQCSIYLSRTTTRKYAGLIAERPLAATAVSTAVIRTACAQLKLLFIAVVCQVFGDHYAARIKTALTKAFQQNACLRVTLTRPDASQTPLTFTPDKSSRCQT